MKTELDNKLLKVEGLIWLPFIGNNYIPNSQKILIVGESHYYKPENENSYDKHIEPNFTREIVQEMCFDREYYNIKLFQNFHLTMMGNDSFDTDVFWNNYSFYNFIQRPMNMEKGERPTYEDIKKAWGTFTELIPLLNPDRVLFLGNTSADHFNAFASNNEVKIEAVEWKKKIGRAYAKQAYIYNGDKKIQLDFIKHPSQYFSWERWREYLLEIGLAK